jgi:hypothetical protein
LKLASYFCCRFNGEKAQMFIARSVTTFAVFLLASLSTHPQALLTLLGRVILARLPRFTPKPQHLQLIRRPELFSSIELRVRGSISMLPMQSMLTARHLQLPSLSIRSRFARRSSTISLRTFCRSLLLPY